MKRYISAILIPCLLLQFFGCYSYREITLEELKSYKGENDIKITTGEKDIIINRDSINSCIMNFGISDSSIIVQERKISQWEPFNNKPIEKNDEIKFHQIENMAIEELDPEKVAGLVLLIVGITAIVTGYIIGQSVPDFSN